MSRQPLSRDDTAILVPALNEALRIREVVTDALTYCAHVIVIDDGSDDGTAECIAGMPVTLIRHPQRMGKGAALRSGFAEAQRLGMRAVMTMDGDGQHKASDFPRLLAAANRHPGCVIIGARMRKRATQPTIRRIGNDFGDWGIAWGCGFRLVDSQSGQRLYPASVFTPARRARRRLRVRSAAADLGRTPGRRARGCGADRNPLRRYVAGHVSQEPFPAGARSVAYHLARGQTGLGVRPCVARISPRARQPGDR